MLWLDIRVPVPVPNLVLLVSTPASPRSALPSVSTRVSVASMLIDSSIHSSLPPVCALLLVCVSRVEGVGTNRRGFEGDGRSFLPRVGKASVQHRPASSAVPDRKKGKRKPPEPTSFETGEATLAAIARVFGKPP